jgi:hypothetical protein
VPARAWRLEPVATLHPAADGELQASPELLQLFTDLLTLVCLDGQWRIVSKVFHYDIQQS